MKFRPNQKRLGLSRAPEICLPGTVCGVKDGKVRSDMFYPAGFMDVVQIEKTKEILDLDHFFGIFGHVELHTFSWWQSKSGPEFAKPFFLEIKWDNLQNVNCYRIFCLSVCGIGLIELGKFDVKKTAPPRSFLRKHGDEKHHWIHPTWTSISQINISIPKDIPTIGRCISY